MRTLGWLPIRSTIASIVELVAANEVRSGAGWLSASQRPTDIGSRWTSAHGLGWQGRPAPVWRRSRGQLVPSTAVTYANIMRHSILFAALIVTPALAAQGSGTSAKDDAPLYSPRRQAIVQRAMRVCYEQIRALAKDEKALFDLDAQFAKTGIVDPDDTEEAKMVCVAFTQGYTIPLLERVLPPNVPVELPDVTIALPPRPSVPKPK